MVVGGGVETVAGGIAVVAAAHAVLLSVVLL